MRSGVYPGIGRRIKLLQQKSLKQKAPEAPAPFVDEQNLIPRPAQREARGDYFFSEA
jgi:hypothetical protein